MSSLAERGSNCTLLGLEGRLCGSFKFRIGVLRLSQSRHGIYSWDEKESGTNLTFTSLLLVRQGLTQLGVSPLLLY